MLYGPIAASRRFRKRVAAGEPIAGAATIDFVNGTYVVNGETVTAADVISDTDRISEDGLSILGSFDNKLDFLGAFRDLLFVRNWTLVVTLDLLALEESNQENTHFWLANTAQTRFIRIETTGGWSHFQEWDGTVQRQLLPDNQHGVGITRIAVTRTPDLAAIAMNGEAAESDGTAVTDIEYSVAETAWHNKSSPAGFIRSIEVMSPVGSAELPALSAI